MDAFLKRVIEQREKDREELVQSVDVAAPPKPLGRPPVLSAQDKAEAMKLRRLGFSYTYITARFGCDRGVIERHLKGVQKGNLK